MLKNILGFYKTTKDCLIFRNKWVYLIESLGMYNKHLETYTLRDIVRVNNGFKCRIEVPFGLLRSGLLEMKPYIEEALNCTFEYDGNNKNNYVQANFIM